MYIMPEAVWSLPLTKALFAIGADLNAGQPSPITVAASIGGNIDVVRFLLSEGAEINTGSFGGSDALLGAISGKDLKIFSLILSKLNNNVLDEPAKLKIGRDNMRVSYQGSPIGLAVCVNSREIVNKLLGRGVKISGTMFSRDPLLLSSVFGYVDLVKIILEESSKRKYRVKIEKAVQAACTRQVFDVLCSAKRDGIQKLCAGLAGRDFPEECPLDVYEKRVSCLRLR